MEQILVDSLTKILISLLSLAVSYGLFYISKAKANLANATAQNIKDESQKKLIQDALDRVALIASNVVARTEQVSASAIREAVKDGKIDKTELEQLGKNAVDDVYAQLKDETKDLLENELSDLQKYITDVVEAEVLKLKVK